MLCPGCRPKADKCTADKCDKCCQIARFDCGVFGYFCEGHHKDEGLPGHYQGVHAIGDAGSCDPALCPFGGAHPNRKTFRWSGRLRTNGLAVGFSATPLVVEVFEDAYAQLGGTYLPQPGMVRGAPWWRRDGGKAWLAASGDRWAFTASREEFDEGGGTVRSAAPRSGAPPDHVAAWEAEGAAVALIVRAAPHGAPAATPPRPELPLAEAMLPEPASLEPRLTLHTPHSEGRSRALQSDPYVPRPVPSRAEAMGAMAGDPSVPRPDSSSLGSVEGGTTEVTSAQTPSPAPAQESPRYPFGSNASGVYAAAMV